jgi:tetratricopeptide (TPR) repeat protein
MIFFRILPVLLLIPVLASPPKPAPVSREQRELRLRQMTAQLGRILAANPTTEGTSNPTLLPLELRFQRNGTGDSLRCLYYVPGTKPQMVVMEELMAHCETYGGRSRDALACLLGHELAHHYHHHGQPGIQFAPFAVRAAKSPYETINLEAIADQSGVFAAYFSGYDAFSMAPRVYADVYDLFLRRREPRGYLPRAQRLQMISDTSMRVQELAHWCELAEFFYLMRDYRAAHAALSEVYKRYPAPFIANNLGAVKLNHALALMGTVQNNPLLRFAFPVEYDTENPLLKTNRRGSEAEYEKLLDEAHQLFEGVLQTRPGYEAARINLSIVQLLQDQKDQARTTLQPLLSTKGPRPANAVLMMGITESVAGNTILALRYLGEAKRLGAYQAAHNEKMGTPEWMDWGKQLFARKKANEAPQQKRQPLPPANLNQGNAEKPLGRIAGAEALYTRTNNLTRYEVSLKAGTDTKRYRLMRSTVQSLPNLPLGSTRQTLITRFARPQREVAGARQTVWLGYGTLQSGLWLEYRANELIGWIAYEPDR